VARTATSSAIPHRTSTRLATFGRTWTKIVEGLPATEFARVVRKTERAGLLFAGTERGAYVHSTTAGTGSRCGVTCPSSQCTTSRSRKATWSRRRHGRSFWILDDIAPLRQFGRLGAGGRRALVPPTRRYRVDWVAGSASARTPRIGRKNPPSGATIYYWLKTGGQEATLDVLDSDGSVIRSFTSVQDSMTRADSLRGDATKRTRTDSLIGRGDGQREGRLDLGDTLKDDEQALPHRPPARPACPRRRASTCSRGNLRLPASHRSGDARYRHRRADGAPGAYRLRLKVGGKEYVRTARACGPARASEPRRPCEQYRFCGSCVIP